MVLHMLCLTGKGIKVTFIGYNTRSSNTYLSRFYPALEGGCAFMKQIFKMQRTFLKLV